MKKMLALLLSVLLALSSMPVLAEEAAGAALPQVGDVVNGFEVVDVTTFPLINADVVYFVHQKTGAELLYLANDDTNRVFEITFRTPAESDMGVPHVFEHATLGGSEKYPSKELFFNLSYQTYNTYMNAATYSHMTTYPVASLSEDQLYMYADFYVDSCFHPMIHTDESIFQEECWRYSMDSAESDLTISGTVYSEMQGAYTLASAAYQNWADVMFPGSNAANSSGGVPSEIPNMTWDDVKNFHTAYYHPSNSLTCLYGAFDNYSRFLELLDGYFSAYEKADIVIADAGYTPISGEMAATFGYPVEASSNTANGGRIYYGFRIDGADEDTVNALDMLSTLLGASSFPVITALKEALPHASCGCGITLDTPVPTIVFYADGVNAEDVDVFRATVDAALEQIVADGFNAEAVDAVAAAFRMDIMLVSESTSLGVDMIPNIAYYWASTGDWHDYVDYIAALDNFVALNADGTFVKLVDQYLVQNTNTALASTFPVAGLKEQNDAALAAELAQIKAGMTGDEIAAIVAETAALAQPAQSDAAQYVAQLQVVTVDSLPEELRIYDYTDVTGEDGVRRINVAANVDGVGQAMVLLNVSDMPQELLHWYQLYTDLLCEVDTSAHTRQELASLTTRYLYNGVIKVSMPFDGQTDMYLRAAWIAADEDMQAAYDLVSEILFDSQFTDAARVAEAVSARKTSLKSSLTSGIYASQLYRAQSISNAGTRAYTYMTDIDYYLFLEEVEALMESNPEVALAMLQAVQQLVNNSTGAISAFAGNAQSAANHQPIADAFLAGLNSREVVTATYDIPVPARAEGIVVDSSVQYNLIYATWEEMGLEEFNASFDAITALVSDTFLIPLLRDQYGAYSVLHAATTDGVYLLSYRDPNVMETFSVYAQLPTLLTELAVDQATLDGYILSSYAYYAQSAGELSGASNAIFTVIAGDDQAESLEWMRQLKSIKAEDVAAYAAVYANMVANGVYSTAGGAAAIEANAALYESVINPFNAVDPTSVEFTDCTSEHPCYDYVRFAFENGLMLPTGDTTFGAEDQATLGDFAMAAYVLLGGGQNPAEAVAYLAQFGIVPAADAATPITREELIACTLNFGAALGLPVTADMLPTFEDLAAPATRAEAAYMIVSFYMLISQ
ncbi:MAG: insulinase family protein [Clostridia bacterium]|nr:insulinase family protein [Clostridia bacterium]